MSAPDPKSRPKSPPKSGPKSGPAPDLSVVITAHDEGLLAGPTVRSTRAAIDRARAAGRRVEALAVLDSPDAETRDWFDRPELADFRVLEVAVRDPFLARNAAVEAAAGRWIAFVDADDLVSENWLELACARLERAEAEGERAIVHPELNWIFEDSHTVFVKQDQDDPLFVPEYLYFGNIWDMMSVAPRTAALELPYAPRDVEGGFGYQDWQWNIETMAAGWRHVVVPDTIIFKRRRAGSISVVNNARKAVVRAVEPMAIDRVRALGRRDASTDTGDGR